MKDFLTNEYKEMVEIHDQDHLYDPNYVIYDEYGVKETHCQRCGTVVIHRKTEMIRCPHCNRTFQVESKHLKELPNLVKIPMDLDNGKYVELLFCARCAHYTDNLTETEEKRILAQLCYGWAKDMKQSRREGKDIQKYLDKRMKLKFVKKEEDKEKIKEK